MDLSRIHKAEIYKALLVDLTESLPYLNENTEQEHMFVSQDLANALIAAIHLENEDYNIAKTYYEKVINNRISISIDNSVYNDINNTEALFTLTYRENYNDANYDFSSFLKKGNFHPIYRNISIQLNYSETLLALNKASELLTVLNKVRAAGNMESLSQLPESPKYEIASLWSKFIGSDYGYFNTLIRLGIAVELLDIQPYELLYPIPIRELYVNQYMTQNPGY